MRADHPTAMFRLLDRKPLVDPNTQAAYWISSGTVTSDQHLVVCLLPDKLFSRLRHGVSLGTTRKYLTVECAELELARACDSYALSMEQETKKHAQ